MSFSILEPVAPEQPNKAESQARATPQGSTWKKARSWAASVQDTWVPEGVAIGFSVCCFFATFGILQAYNQQPSPTFPHGLTLNAIVSVLATASKASLVLTVAESLGQLKWIRFYKSKRELCDMQSMDNASRGPLGSLKVMFVDRGFSLASLGALIIILCLAFDPFMQQILSYPVRVRPSPNEMAGVQKADIFYPSEILNTLFVSIWSNADSFTLMDPTCPSGNCTWPLFDSVGLCSKCGDVTSQAMLTGCNMMPITSNKTESMAMPCNVSLPQGKAWPSLIQINRLPPNTFSNGGAGGSMSRPEDAVEILHPKNSLWLLTDRDFPISNETFQGVMNPLMAWALAEMEPSAKASSYSAILDPSNPQKLLDIHRVTECILTPCSRTYNVTVTGGMQSIDVQSMNLGELFVFKSQSSIAWRANVGEPVHMKMVDPEHGLWVDQSVPAFNDVVGLSAYLHDYLQSNDSDWKLLYADGEAGVTMDQRNLMTENIDRIVKIGLERVINNLATLLTKSNTNNWGKQVNGTVGISEVYVSVDWLWFILPAIVLVLGIVFFVSTILVTRAQNLSPWKTSILAVLYHGLDDGSLHSGDHSCLSEMERTAESVHVSLGLSHRNNRLILRAHSTSTISPSDAQDDTAFSPNSPQSFRSRASSTSHGVEYSETPRGSASSLNSTGREPEVQGTTG